MSEEELTVFLVIGEREATHTMVENEGRNMDFSVVKLENDRHKSRVLTLITVVG